MDLTGCITSTDVFTLVVIVGYRRYHTFTIFAHADLNNTESVFTVLQVVLTEAFIR